MRLSHNCNKITLLFNSPIDVYDNNKTIFTIKTPSIEDINKYQFIDQFLNIIKITPEDLGPQLKDIGIIAETKFDILLFLVEQVEYKDIIINALTFLIPNSEFYTNGFWTINNIEVTNEIYNVILDVLLTSIDYKSQTKTTDDDLTAQIKKRQAETERKLAKIKGKKEEEKGETITIENVIFRVIFEIPTISLTDIQHMNYSTLMFFFSKIPEIVEQKTQLAALAQVGKFNYFK